MDPWVKTQIRLAERQGLLTGTALSPVQVKAVFLRELVDTADRAIAEDRSVRKALITTGKYDYDTLFPEYAITPDEDPVDTLNPDLDSSDGTIYVFEEMASPDFDRDEAQRLLNELVSGSSSGSVSAADMDRP